MQIDWPLEHSQALRDHLARGLLSYAAIARAINAAFNTAYTRNAAIGRARRMGISGADHPNDSVRPKAPRQPRSPGLSRKRKRAAAPPRLLRPVFKRAAALQLRCIGIVPRHLSLLELEPGDCRYPFGGDAEGEPVTFCGHQRRDGSSYCVSHFHLTCGEGSASERSAVKVLLRLVAA
jgi:GcrA cell cycle regulator